MSSESLHMAIIPDGNRRWAKRHALLPWQGHKKAVENFQSLIEWCYDSDDISVLTIWGFSTENWKRDRAEIDHLMELFESFLVSEHDHFLQQKIRVVHAGRRDRLPLSLMTALDALVAATADFENFTFQLALDYGGKDEIVRGLQNISDTSSLTDDALRAHLDHPELPDIDLIVRTSGEQRTSNFFLWQSTYAEWFFIEKHFPELSTDDLGQVLTEFNQRQRRFGGG